MNFVSDRHLNQANLSVPWIASPGPRIRFHTMKQLLQKIALTDQMRKLKEKNSTPTVHLYYLVLFFLMAVHNYRLHTSFKVTVFLFL